MSVNDLAQNLEDAAREALFQARAVYSCARHHDVTIRVYDDEAERRAYAIATNVLKSGGAMFLREDLMATIKDTLDMAADDECPACAAIRDE